MGYLVLVYELIMFMLFFVFVICCLFCVGCVVMWVSLLVCLLIFDYWSIYSFVYEIKLCEIFWLGDVNNKEILLWYKELINLVKEVDMF